MREQDFRQTEFSYFGTMVRSDGETDIFRSADGTLRIEAALEPQGRFGAMAFCGVQVMDAAGPVTILGEDELQIGEEEIQVIAFGILEENVARMLEYAHGRYPTAVPECDVLPAEGVYIDRSELDEEIINSFANIEEMIPG